MKGVWFTNKLGEFAVKDVGQGNIVTLQLIIFVSAA